MASSSAAGLTLHRSETTAHCVDIFDQKGGTARASTRARGRCEGHQSKPNSIFKPLGNPVKNERIVEMNATRLTKVEQTCAMVVANVGSQHHDGRPKGGGAEGGADFGGTARSKAGDLAGDDKAGSAAEAERAQREQLAHRPHGLFGKDLPRCKCHGRRHVADGFGRLRSSIRESEARVQQVRTDCAGGVRGFDRGAAKLEALLPPRERYPPEPAEGGPARLEAPAAPAQLQSLAPSPPSEPRPGLGPRRPPPPQAARRPAVPGFHHHHADHALSLEKRAGRAQPHRLQSLDDFIASAGPAMGVGGRSERSEGLKLREQINELLGLDKNVTLKLPPEEPGGRRGRLDIRKRIEKRMDEAWSNRAFLKQCSSAYKDAAERIASIERILREEAASGDIDDESKVASMSKLATIERYLRDLSALSDERGGNEAERTNGGAGAPGEERDAAGAAWAEAAEGAERRRKRERFESDEAAGSAARFAAVAKLRAVLHSYQASRDEKRLSLEELLQAMDANRPNLLRRKAALGSSGSPELKASSAGAAARPEAEACDDQLQRQHAWYRELLCRMQDDKQNLPRVAHYIFDCVRQVLESGEEFQREVFFAMLEKIQNFEFSRLIAGLVVNMIRGIEGVAMQDLLGWFEQNRGEVPPAILELSSRRAGAAGPPSAPRPPSGPRLAKTLTFVTEMS